MRLFATLFAAGLMASTSAQAATIVGLCNTGRTDVAAGCGANATGPDANWTVNGGTAFANNGINGAWISNTAAGTASRWITPTSNPNASLDPTSNGTYNYSLDFVIPAAFDPKSGKFSGRFAVDNTVRSITLNGVTLAASGGSFNIWTAFAANSGFKSGLNTLMFNTVNTRQATGNPAGLRVEFTNSSIGVPEPATWAFMILGFGLIGGALRSRKAGVTAKVAYA
jgi:PEP-CTERM motif